MILQVAIQFSFYSKSSVIFEREGSSNFIHVLHGWWLQSKRAQKYAYRSSVVFYHVVSSISVWERRQIHSIAAHKCNPLKYWIINFYKRGAIDSRNLSSNKNWSVRWKLWEKGPKSLQLCFNVNCLDYH